jgi:hypothetical protein
MPNFMKIRPVDAELFQAEGHDAVYYKANAPKNGS